MRTKLFLSGMVLLPLALVAAVCGNETTRIETPAGDSQVRGISVNGEGRVPAPPDVAVLSLGVSVLRPSVGQARDEAAAKMTAIIDALEANGVAEKDIQTDQLSIYPEYDYSGNTQTLRGFRVSNTVTAKVREVDRTGDAVDAAVEAGGDDTTINGISFTIDDPEALREGARQSAVEDARKKAETLAAASGVEIGNPISISEHGAGEPPVVFDRSFAGAQAADEATPIEPGEVEVMVSVTVTWEIQP